MKLGWIENPENLDMESTVFLHSLWKSLNFSASETRNKESLSNICCLSNAEEEEESILEELRKDHLLSEL